MKCKFIISDSKSYSVQRKYGNLVVFRTIDSLICWNLTDGKVAWENIFEDDSEAGEKLLCISGGLAVTYIYRKLLDIQVVAVGIQTGKIVRNRNLELSIKGECFSVFEEKLYLFGSGADDRFVVQELNVNNGEIISQYNGRSGKFMFHHQGGLCIGGADGVFQVTNERIDKLSAVSIYACLNSDLGLFIVWGTGAGKLWFGKVEAFPEDFAIYAEMSTSSFSSWNISQFGQNKILARNGPENLCFVVENMDSGVKCTPVVDEAGNKISQIACTSTDCYSLVQRADNLKYQIARMKLQEDPELEFIPEIVRPRTIEEIDGMLLVGGLGTIELWQ